MLNVKIWIGTRLSMKTLREIRDDLHGSAWLRTPDHVSFTTDLAPAVVCAVTERWRVVTGFTIEITPNAG